MKGGLILQIISTKCIALMSNNEFTSVFCLMQSGIAITYIHVTTELIGAYRSALAVNYCLHCPLLGTGVIPQMLSVEYCTPPKTLIITQF